MRPGSIAWLWLLLLGTGAGASAQEIDRLPPPAPGLPFAEAVRVGGLIFLSGQIGVVPQGGQLRLVDGGIGPETRQTMANIATTLERMGSSLDRVVKCTSMLADMSEWEAMNEAYVPFFPDGPPARSAFGANGLALGARVEIECVAAAGT